MLFAVSLIFVS